MCTTNHNLPLSHLAFTNATPSHSAAIPPAPSSATCVTECIYRATPQPRSERGTGFTTPHRKYRATPNPDYNGPLDSPPDTLISCRNRSPSLSGDSGWWVKEQSTAWVWKFLMSKYAQHDMPRWRRHMWMSPSRFFGLVEVLRPHITLKTTNWRSPHPLELRLGVCIYKMASGAIDLHVSKSCGICESTVMDILQQVVPKFIDLFHHKIGWPHTVEGMDELIDGFASWSSLPGVVGAVDGTEIRIIKPKIPNAFPYYNYKVWDHAMTLQAVCDSNRRFLAISTGCPGSFYDSRVLRLSGLYLQAQSTSLPQLRYPVHLPATAAQLANSPAPPQCVSTYIVGNKAYPCLPWLIGPYKIFRNRVTPAKERHFNRELTQARLHVERAFLLLKVLWRSMAGSLVKPSTTVSYYRAHGCNYQSCCLLKATGEKKWNDVPRA